VTVSAKGEYAIKAMLDLALTDDGERLQPIQDIARRQGIPQRYLEQVLLGLKRVGFLHSRRGWRAVTVSPRRPTRSPSALCSAPSRGAREWERPGAEPMALPRMPPGIWATCGEPYLRRWTPWWTAPRSKI